MNNHAVAQPQRRLRALIPAEQARARVELGERSESSDLRRVLRAASPNGSFGCVEIRLVNWTKCCLKEHVSGAVMA